jgi:hypothetical protein
MNHARHVSADQKVQTPRFATGDPVRDAESREPGRIQYARSDGMVCVIWLNSGSREWCHQDSLVWAPDLQPLWR